MVTPQTHPALGWQRLVGTLQTPRGPLPMNFPHVLWVVTGNDPWWIYAYSQRTGQVLNRPCSTPGMQMLRLYDWARQFG